MDEDVKIWLYDILTSINEIESYYVNVPKMFQIYENDLKTKRAVFNNECDSSFPGITKVL